MEEAFDVCIIGAGVAGGAMAAYLGKNGVKVAVVEKNLSERDVMIGELLQPGGVEQLRQMQLEHLLEGFDAQEMEGYALFMNNDCFQIPYPTENGKQVRGRGFRNGKFVQEIRKYAQAEPNVSLLEGTVTELTEENSRITGVKYISKEDKEERSIKAALTIVSDGMFSVFREQLSENEKKVSSYFLGLILKDCVLPYKNHGHVIVAKPSPCLVYPISSTETRMLIDFPQSEAPRKSQELTDYLNKEVAPQLPKEILPSFYAAVDEGKFRVMPNHLIPAKPVFKEGAVLLGDSLNMRHPLTGGGMTAALTDVRNLGTELIALKDFSNNERVNEAVKDFYKTRHNQNATINILADALYGVMKNEDLKEACYNYLKRGGTYAEEPVSILSAVSRNKNLLLRHFFAVAFYGIKDIVGTLPSAKKIKRSQQLLRDAVDIVSPLVMNEKPGLFTKYSFQLAEKLVA